MYRVRFLNSANFNVSLRRSDIYCGSQFIAVEREWGIYTWIYILLLTSYEIAAEIILIYYLRLNIISLLSKNRDKEHNHKCEMKTESSVEDIKLSLQVYRRIYWLKHFWKIKFAVLEDLYVRFINILIDFSRRKEFRSCNRCKICKWNC